MVEQGRAAISYAAWASPSKYHPHEIGVQRAEKLLVRNQGKLDRFLDSHWTLVTYRERVVRGIPARADFNYAIAMAIRLTYGIEVPYDHVVVALARCSFREDIYRRTWPVCSSETSNGLSRDGLCVAELISRGVIRPEYMKGWENEKLVRSV